MTLSLKRFYSGIILLSVLVTACNKHNSSNPAYSKAHFDFKLKVGSSALELDTMKYFNAAGNPFGVNRMNCYISAITLKRSDGRKYTSNKVFYIDPMLASKSFFNLDSIPSGSYTEISFLMGLDTTHNKTNALPITIDNLNMAWPDMMGGGYHFLKLEGNYADLGGSKKGYAVHLGRNKNLVTVVLTTKLSQFYWDHSYSIMFDIKEVFQNPYTYDFNVEKTYTMSDTAAMTKIKNNISDAFSITQNK